MKNKMQTTAKFTRVFPLYIIVPPSDKPYHKNGTPLAFAYYTVGGTPSYYFYETNLQGDVVAIYDSNGSKVVSFVYDAWGNFTVNAENSTICSEDPFFFEAKFQCARMEVVVKWD